MAYSLLTQPAECGVGHLYIDEHRTMRRVIMLMGLKTVAIDNSDLPEYTGQRQEACNQAA